MVGHPHNFYTKIILLMFARCHQILFLGMRNSVKGSTEYLTDNCWKKSHSQIMQSRRGFQLIANAQTLHQSCFLATTSSFTWHVSWLVLLQKYTKLIVSLLYLFVNMYMKLVLNNRPRKGIEGWVGLHCNDELTALFSLYMKRSLYPEAKNDVCNIATTPPPSWMLSKSYLRPKLLLVA